MSIVTPEMRLGYLFASIPSPRTLRAELLRLCARIGYSPPAIL